MLCRLGATCLLSHIMHHPVIVLLIKSSLKFCQPGLQLRAFLASLWALQHQLAAPAHCVQ